MTLGLCNWPGFIRIRHCHSCCTGIFHLYKQRVTSALNLQLSVCTQLQSQYSQINRTLSSLTSEGLGGEESREGERVEEEWGGEGGGEGERTPSQGDVLGGRGHIVFLAPR